MWCFRLSEEQRQLILEFARLEKGTPGTVSGFGNDPNQSKAEDQSGSSQPDKEEKLGIFGKLKKALLGWSTMLSTFFRNSSISLRAVRCISTTLLQRNNADSYIPDYYTVLGVSRGSEVKDIKVAYFRMAKKYHPDSNNTDHARFMFQLVAEAYEVCNFSWWSLLFDSLKNMMTINVNLSKGTDGWRKTEIVRRTWVCLFNRWWEIKWASSSVWKPDTHSRRAFQ